MIDRFPFHVAIATDTPDTTRATIEALLQVELFEVPDNARAPQSFDAAGMPVPRPRAWHGGKGPLRVEVLSGEPGSAYAPEPGAHVHHLAYWTDDFLDDVSALVREGWEIECSGRDEQGRPSRWAYLGRVGDQRVELVDASRRHWYDELVDPRDGGQRAESA